MPKLSPVVWSKGVFLSPQHLQAQDRYTEDRMRFELDALVFKGWGFTGLALDATALPAGSLALAEAAGIFPDGLPFAIPASDEPPSSRALESCFSGGRQRCQFYLAVPEHRPAGMNVSLGQDRMSTRFFSEPRMVRDENTALVTERAIPLARKNLQILAEGENMAGFITLPLAVIEQTEAGLYRPDPKYIPPVVDLHASPALQTILRGLIELLVARSSQLSGARRQKNDALIEFSASDIASFWLLYTMNTELPSLRHMLEATRVHPQDLFRAMLRLAGSLMTFSPRYQPRDLPTYDHERPGGVFGLLDGILRELLGTVVPSNFVALPLAPVQPSVYATAIDKDQYFRDSRFYLAVSADVPEPELIQRFPHLAKVSAATHIENYIRQALPGLRMVHVPVPPRAIPVKLRYQYFSLERAGDVWDQVVRARNLAVYVPGEVVNPQMELIVLFAAPE